MDEQHTQPLAAIERQERNEEHIRRIDDARTRTIAVVATELQNAMDAASRVPRLRAELDALLGKKTRKSVAK